MGLYRKVEYINNIKQAGESILKSLQRIVLFEDNIKSKISPMSTEPELEINEYTLTILSVKMKVKFPCKMKLEHSGNSLTDQVESQEHARFLFNQEVTIQEPAQQSSVDFNILLVTEKGSKYVSGLVKLPTIDLEKAEGQKIITPLTKCLDPQAYCEIKVNKVKVGKVQKRISVSSTLIQLKRLNSNQLKSKTSAKEEVDLLSPKAKKGNGVETRSEVGFGGMGVKSGHEWEETRSKGAAQTLIYKSSFLKSPNSKKTMAMLSPKSRLAPDLNPDYELLSQRQKLTNADSQVYREGYQKLKQKYKVQAESLNCEISKRQQLQANENNYKVEIMRLKLKAEEQERIITQKNQKINQLQINISQINRQHLDNTFLKQENQNLQEKISILNDTIHCLKKQNQNIKSLYEQKQRNNNNIIEELRAQLQSSKQKLQTYSLETSESIRQKTQQIISLTNQIKSKSQQIQLQRSEIYKLQAHGQTKLYQFEQTLQQQKNAGGQLANQLRQKIQVLEREKKELVNELGEMKNDKEKIKGLILKAEYDKKVLQEEVKTLKAELGQFKGIKEQQVHLQRELVMLTEDKKQLRKQLQAQAQSKEVNLQQINEQYELKLQHYKKQARSYQEKHRTVTNVKIQLQSQLQTANNLVQKQKRQLQTVNNELASVKTSLKENKHYVQELEHKRLNLENDLLIAFNKLKFGEHTHKAQVYKVKTQLDRCKNQLAIENSKAIQLFETKSSLETQLNKSKIQLQYHEDKIDKLFSANKELHATLDSLSKQHETLTHDLNQQIIKLQSQLKISHEALHQAQLTQLSSTDKLQTLKKQLKLAQERVSFLENQLKNKSEEIVQLDLKHKFLEKTFSSLEQEHSALKHQHNVLKNQKQKVEKISELKTQEITQLKGECEKLQQEIQCLERTQLELREQLKKQHQSHVKVEMKQKAVEREFNKFKQLIYTTIKTQYAKLPLLANNQQTQSQQSQKREPRNNDSRVTVVLNGSAREIQISPEQVVLQTLSPSGILSQLNHSINDSKTTLFKLIEHNKQLKKEIDSLKQQSEQSSHKHQFTEIQLHREIQNIEQELHQVYDQKQDQILNYERLVSELNAKLHEKENLCEQLTQQIEELEYAISSLKLEFQTNSNKNDKKVVLLKQTIQELEEKIEFYKVSLSNQEDRTHELEEKVQILRGQKQEITEQATKLKGMLEQICRQKQNLEVSLEEVSRERKCLVEQLNQSRLQLNERKQLKSKVEHLLSQEEKKTGELKQFVSSLMKQKENIIRSELEKTDRILDLETKEIQLKTDLELSSQENLRLKSELEQLKDKLRHETTTVKQLETQLNESHTKCRKLTQKLQQKEREIQMKDEIIARLDLKYRELTEKNYKESLQLHSQIDSKYSENITLNRELNQKILLLQAKLEELEHIKAKQHHDNLMLNDQLLAEKEHYSLIKSQNKKLEMQLEEVNEEYKSVQTRNSQLITQIEAREEQVTQLNDKVILLEAEIEALNKDKLIQIEQTTLEWSAKLNSLVEEHQHKLKLIENQRELIRSQLEQKINQLQLSCTQNVHSELSLNDIKLNYQTKLKQLQTQTLSLAQTKNLQINQLTQQNQLLSQQIQQLESALKQNSQLLDNLRKRLLNEEKLKKELEIKHSSTLKLHQAELNALLSKQHKLNQQLETLYQTLWSNEREVRKVAQNYLKKILDHCDSQHIDKITSSSKGLEAELVKAMTLNLSISP